MNATPSSTLHFTSMTACDGIAERTFALGGISRVLRSPESAAGGTPLLLMGHGDRPRSGQDQPQAGAIGQARAAGERALVLGGGGGAGDAWEIGVIVGLFDAGLDVTGADLIIGTLAGSTSAAHLPG